jgi:uncharacterized protein (TIGR03067 family)
MSSCHFLILAAGVLLTADARDDQHDREKLQGTWRVVRMEHAGKNVPAEQVAAMRVIIQGNELTGKEGDQVRERFTFTLDSSSRPKAIDTTAVEGPAKGDTSRGIYELEGHRLKICVSEKGKQRPTEFAAKEGTDFVLLVLEREKR